MFNKSIFSVLITSLLAFTLTGQTFENYSATECAELISENKNNPNFIILDVRTANEHNPQHLSGSIMRNFYDNDFDAQLDQLNKDKTYLIHCRSGARSGAAYTKMQSLGFQSVYNMLGGINSWNSNGLPTTHLFAPQIMLISDSIINITPIVNTTDTITIVLTNRANDELILNQISWLYNGEFTSDFQIGTTLLGGEDYSFNIFFTPLSVRVESLLLEIQSNAGVQIINLNIDVQTSNNNFTIEEFSTCFPNPVSNDLITIATKNLGITHYEIWTLSGEKVMHGDFIRKATINLSGITKSQYIIKVTQGKSVQTHMFAVIR